MSKKIKNSKDKAGVVVFGGSGFLGSHVADALSDAGYRVRLFDQKKSPFLREDQEMIIGDIRDNAKVCDAVRGCAYVYNFAGMADLDDASTKPQDTIDLNVTGNVNVMEAALKAGVKRFIYASTIYVYSDKGGFYRASKQASELYIEEYHRRFGLDFTILRYSTLYGPRADERNSIYRYLKQALAGEKIEVYGSGRQVRDYVHVRDAARLSVDILDERYENRHLIISGHHPIKFQDMILLMGEMLGKEIKVIPSQKASLAHYDYTPYSFTPKIGHKLTNHLYLDMGQGLLECLQEIHEKKMSSTSKSKHAPKRETALTR